MAQEKTGKNKYDDKQTKGRKRHQERCTEEGKKFQGVHQIQESSKDIEEEGRTEDRLRPALGNGKNTKSTDPMPMTKGANRHDSQRMYHAGGAPIYQKGLSMLHLQNI